MKIIRASFYIALAVFLMPAPPQDGNIQDIDLEQAAMPTQQVIGAAASTVGDAHAFCDRQPDVCDTAGHLLRKFEAKAKYSMRLLYEWANSEGLHTELPSVLKDQAKVDPVVTGAAGVRTADAMVEPEASTLRIEDLILQWRDPAEGNNS